jgi:hypothetical protein
MRNQRSSITAASILLILTISGCVPSVVVPTSTLPPSPTSLPPTSTSEPTENADEIPTQSGPSSSSDQSMDPVRIPVLCTLMGREPEIVAPADQAVILVWGWSAETEEQVFDYIEAGETIVMLDDRVVQGSLVGEVAFIESWGSFGAVWEAEIGVLAPGSYRLTYNVSWDREIFDGQSSYGPGTENETSEDACVLIVE